MRIFALGLLVGTLILQQFRHLPDAQWAWAMPLALLLPWRLPWWRGFAAMLIGFGWSLLFSSSSLDHRLAESFEGQLIRLQGRVIGLPQNRRDDVQFYVRPYAMQGLGSKTSYVASKTLPRKIKLSWFYSQQTLQSGEYVDLTVKLKRPNGLMNPAGFDYETWLFSHSVDAIGYVRQRHLSSDIAPAPSHFSDFVDIWRQRVFTKLQQSSNGLDNTGLILALVIGDRSAVSSHQWQLLQNTGTNHLLAISGLHIGLVAALVFFATRRLWPRLGLTQVIAAQRAATIFALLAACAYAALAGFSIPTQRALIMLSVLLLAQWRQRPLLPSQGLSAALVGVLLLNPLSVLDAGFWLSFVAVASLLYSLSARRGILVFYRRWLQPQLAVFFGLSLCLLLLFRQIPLLSPLANMLAIPWVSVVSVPLCLGAVPFLWLAPSLAHAMLAGADASLSLLQQVLRGLDSVHWLLQITEVASLWPWLLALVAVLFLLLPFSLMLRAAALVLLTPLLFAPVTPLGNGQFRVVFLDVGQGLSVVVATRRHVMVYDSGPRFSKNFDAAGAAIIPLLKQMHYRKIDRLVLSHHDSDHMGAATSLLKNYLVEQILTTYTDNSLKNVNSCQAYKRWRWDNVQFEVLHPSPQWPAGESDNNHSCVIKISSGGHSVLLTGDIETEVERTLVERLKPEQLHADILLVPHHGSNSSSSVNFIDTVSPQWAVASAGYRNRFGFPKAKIVERYLQRGIAFLSTSHYGALTFQFDGLAKPRLLHAERIDKSRYWHRAYAPPSAYGIRYHPRSGQED